MHLSSFILMNAEFLLEKNNNVFTKIHHLGGSLMANPYSLSFLP